MITFGIITAGGNEKLIDRTIKSIRENHIQEYEIIVVGGGPVAAFDTIHIPFDESVKPAWITRKKNIITEVAHGKYVVYLHDYFWFSPKWYEHVKLAMDKGFDVGMTRMVNQNGERFRDWTLDACLPMDYYLPKERTRERLLPYDLNVSKIQYISGAYWIARKEVMVKCPLYEKLCAGHAEDVEWAQRVREQYKFTMIDHPDCFVRCQKPKLVSFRVMGPDWENALRAMTPLQLDWMNQECRNYYDVKMKGLRP